MEHCFGNNIKSKMGIFNLIRKNNYTQNLKILAPIGTEKSVTEIFIGEKEKLTNIGTNKRYVAVFVTQCNSPLSSFVPNFRILRLNSSCNVLELFSSDNFFTASLIEKNLSK